MAFEQVYGGELVPWKAFGWIHAVVDGGQFLHFGIERVVGDDFEPVHVGSRFGLLSGFLFAFFICFSTGSRMGIRHCR